MSESSFCLDLNEALPSDAEMARILAKCNYRLLLERRARVHPLAFKASLMTMVSCIVSSARSGKRRIGWSFPYLLVCSAVMLKVNCFVLGPSAGQTLTGFSGIRTLCEAITVFRIWWNSRIHRCAIHVSTGIWCVYMRCRLLQVREVPG